MSLVNLFNLFIQDRKMEVCRKHTLFELFFCHHLHPSSDFIISIDLNIKTNFDGTAPKQLLSVKYAIRCFYLKIELLLSDT